MNVIFNVSLCFHAHAWNMSAFLFYTIPSIRLIHPSLFCIFCKFFEIRCSNSASYFKCQISMSSIIPYLLILYVLSKLHDRIKHFSIFLRCKRTAPHRILSCIWVISLFSSLVLVAIKNTYIPTAQKEPLIKVVPVRRTAPWQCWHLSGATFPMVLKCWYGKDIYRWRDQISPRKS